MEAVTASRGSKGDDDDSNKHNKGKNLEKPHNNPTPKKPKQSRGRQKIKIERIVNEEARLCTFSKRKSSIYKKVNEIFTLTGAQLGLAMITPAGRVFSFAQPSIDNIISRFLTQQAHHPRQQLPLVQPMPHQMMNVVDTIIEAHRKVRMDSLNRRHDYLVDIMKAEKKKLTALVESNCPFENTYGSQKDDTNHWWALMSNEKLTDENVDRLAEEIQNFLIEIGKTRLMREIRFTMTAPPGSDDAGPSYPPLSPMRGFMTDNIIYPPQLPMQVVLNYYPPSPKLSMQLMPPMHGIMANVNVHENSLIVGEMLHDGEHAKDMAMSYFDNSEDPRARDF